MSRSASFLLVCITLTSTISLSATEKKSPYKECTAADNAVVFGASTPPIDLVFFIDHFVDDEEQLRQEYDFYSRLACFFVDYKTKATGKHRVALAGYSADGGGRLKVNFTLAAAGGALQRQLRAMTDPELLEGSYGKTDLCYALDHVNGDAFKGRPTRADEADFKRARLVLVAWRAAALVTCDQFEEDEEVTLDDRLTGANKKTDLVVVVPKDANEALFSQASHIHELAGLATGWEAGATFDVNVTGLALAIRQLVAAQHAVNHRTTTTTTTTGSPPPVTVTQDEAPDKLEPAVDRLTDEEAKENQKEKEEEAERARAPPIWFIIFSVIALIAFLLVLAAVVAFIVYVHRHGRAKRQAW